jgi:hypothetical protein
VSNPSHQKHRNFAVHHSNTTGIPPATGTGSIDNIVAQQTVYSPSQIQFQGSM